MEIWKYFKVLLHPILTLLDWGKQFFLTYFGYIFALLIVALTPLGWALDTFVSWVTWADDKVQTLTDILNNVWSTAELKYPAIVQTLALANAFFPIDTLFAAWNVLIGAYLAFIAYRLVKSWIPTLS